MQCSRKHSPAPSSRRSSSSATARRVGARPSSRRGGNPRSWRPSKHPTHRLCFYAYSTLVPGTTRTPLRSTEHLTPGAINEARHPTRDSALFTTSCPCPQRTGVSTRRPRRQLRPRAYVVKWRLRRQRVPTSSLTNVVPQNPTSNRRMRSHLETSIRRLARQFGSAHMVTGPAFTAQEPRFLNGRARYPTSCG